MMIFVDVPDAKTFIPALYEDSKLWIQLYRPGRWKSDGVILRSEVRSLLDVSYIQQ